MALPLLRLRSPRWAPGSPGHGHTLVLSCTETRLSLHTPGPRPCLGPACAHLPQCLLWPHACPSLPKTSAPVPICIHLQPDAHLAVKSPLPMQYQHLPLCPSVSPCPSPVPCPPISTQTSALRVPEAQAHLSRCLGTAGCGSRCPSPRCSSTCHVTFRARMLSQASGAAVSK